MKRSEETRRDGKQRREEAPVQEKDSLLPISVFHFFHPRSRLCLYSSPSCLFHPFSPSFFHSATLSLCLSFLFHALPFILVLVWPTGGRSSRPFLSILASKCGIQQGFYGACGGAESAPVCRDAGCTGEMMRRLAGSSQKPPPSASSPPPTTVRPL